MKIVRKVFLPVSILVLVILIVLAFNSTKVETGDVENKPQEIKDEIKHASLTLVGDFLYEEPYYEALRNGDDEDLYFSRVRKLFQEDDLSIGNMEVVIGTDDMKMSGTGFSFCAPQSIGKKVVDLGMDVLTTANNHSNDRGVEGRVSTLDFFRDNSDILTVGTYKEGERNVLSNIKEVDGIKFGFLAYTYGTNVKIPNNLREGIGLYRDPDNVNHAAYEEKMWEEIRTLRSEVDVLVVLMHWGREFTYTPGESEQTIAKKMNELGVDIIAGSHSHSIQPIEWIRSDKHDTLVYYSLGNFVSADDDISRTGETFDNAYQIGLLSTLEVDKDKNGIYIKNVKAKPVINYYDTNMRNFQLVPFSEYDEDLEKSHYRYKYNFNRSFIEEAYNRVIDSQFR